MKTESLNLLQRLSKVSALWRSTYNIFLLEHTWGKWGPVVSARTTATVTTLRRLPAAGLWVQRLAGVARLCCTDTPLQGNDRGVETGREGLHLRQWLGVRLAEERPI